MTNTVVLSVETPIAGAIVAVFVAPTYPVMTRV